MRYRVDICMNGVWHECRLAKIAAQLEPGSFGSFPTRDKADDFIKNWNPRDCKKPKMRVVEVNSVGNKG